MASKKMWIAAMIIALTAILLLGACADAKTAEEPFRLHIKANSNSEADQNVKLKVRDAVLEAAKDGIARCKTAAQAEEYIEKNLGILLETANDTLAQNGFCYTAGIELGRFHFPEKSYREVTYSEGEYDALRITLGKGRGDNWWCVMFPPLCLYEIENTEEAEYTSFLAELWEAIFGS